MCSCFQYKEKKKLFSGLAWPSGGWQGLYRDDHARKFGKITFPQPYRCVTLASQRRLRIIHSIEIRLLQCTVDDCPFVSFIAGSIVLFSPICVFMWTKQLNNTWDDFPQTWWDYYCRCLTFRADRVKAKVIKWPHLHISQEISADNRTIYIYQEIITHHMMSYDKRLHTGEGARKWHHA